MSTRLSNTQDSPAPVVYAIKPSDTPNVPTICPTHSVKFPGTKEIQSIDFSPDGRTAYCAVVGQSVDLWAATVSMWPELLGALVALTFAVWCLVVVRVNRRAQVSGDPHCRRCNFNVRIQARVRVHLGRDPGSRCPECGSDLLRKSPRIGRTRARRLWPTTAIMLLIAGGYVGMWATGVRRAGPLSTAVDWWSTWVDEKIETHQIGWLLKHRIEVARIIKIDSTNGAIVGNLRTERARLHSEIRVSPDGRFIAFSNGQDRLCWINARDGSMSVPAVTINGMQTGLGSRGIVGFDGADDDPYVYIATVDQVQKASRLLRWRPSTGEHHVVVDEPSCGNLSLQGVIQLPRRYAILKWPSGTATLSAPNYLSCSYEYGNTAWIIRNPMIKGDGAIRVMEKTGSYATRSSVETTHDGSIVFVSDGGNGIVGVNPKSGEPIGVLKNIAAPLAAPISLFRVSPIGTKLFVEVDSDLVLVRDLKLRTWIGRAVLPSGYIMQSLETSACGQWLAASAFPDSQRSKSSVASRYGTELFLFDLSPLDQADSSK